MASDDAADIREADAGALEFGLGVEALKDAEEFGGVFHVESDAVIAHVEDVFGGVYALGNGADFDARVGGGRGVFGGVLDEIGPDLPEHGGVGADGGQRFDVPLDGFFAIEADVADDAGDELVVVEGGDIHLGPTHAGKREQIVDEAAHAASGVGDDGKVAGGFFVEGSAGVFGEQGGEAVDVAEGCAEVVRDGVGEGFELLVGDFEAGVLELEVAVEFADFGVGAFAFGDVANDGERFRSLVGFERAEHDIDGEFAVVLAAAGEFEAGAHGAGARAGEVGGEMAAVAGVETLRQKLFEALSGEFIASPPEKAFGLAVGAGDLTAGADLDDGVGGVVEQALEHAFALAHGLFGAETLANIAANEEAGADEENDGESAAEKGDGGVGESGVGRRGRVFGEEATLLLLHEQDDAAQPVNGSLAAEEWGRSGRDIEISLPTLGDARAHDLDGGGDSGFELVEPALLLGVADGVAAQRGERGADGGFGPLEGRQQAFGAGQHKATRRRLHGKRLDHNGLKPVENAVGLLDAFEGALEALSVPAGGRGDQDEDEGGCGEADGDFLFEGRVQAWSGPGNASDCPPKRGGDFYAKQLQVLA